MISSLRGIYEHLYGAFTSDQRCAAFRRLLRNAKTALANCAGATAHRRLQRAAARNQSQRCGVRRLMERTLPVGRIHAAVEAGFSEHQRKTTPRVANVPKGRRFGIWRRRLRPKLGRIIEKAVGRSRLYARRLLARFPMFRSPTLPAARWSPGTIRYRRRGSGLFRGGAEPERLFGRRPGPIPATSTATASTGTWSAA